MPPFLCPADNSDGGYAVSSYRRSTRRWARSTTCAAGRRAAPRGHQPGAGLHLQPHRRRARLGACGGGGGGGLPRLLPDLSGPHAARRLRPYAARDLPGPAPGRLHPAGRRALDLVDFQLFSVGPELRQPRRSSTPMAGEMLAIANLGAEIPCAWTPWPSSGSSWAPTCENLPPQAHAPGCRAFNAVCRIAAPGCCSSPRPSCTGPGGEAHRAGGMPALHNPLQMALLWNSLATREVNLLQQALEERHARPRAPPGQPRAATTTSGWTLRCRSMPPGRSS